MKYKILITLLLLTQACTCTANAQESVGLLEVDPARIEVNVRKLSVDFYPRSAYWKKTLNGAADYIAKQFHDSSDRVSEQTFAVDGSSYRNIIARFGPKDGSLLVVGAHYDSCGDTPGADDNASGVAGLLELAILMKKHPPSRPVELVAYSLEEPPFFNTNDMGSFIHASSLVASKTDVQLMISLEMIGYYTDSPDSQNYPVPGMDLLFPSVGNYIAITGRLEERQMTKELQRLMSKETDLSVQSFNAPSSFSGLSLSDHRNYWKTGFNAVMITDTAYMRNANYHKRSDTFDTLNYKKIGDVVKGVFGIISNLKQ